MRAHLIKLPPPGSQSPLTGVVAKDGLLWRTHGRPKPAEMIDCPEADRIANLCGLMSAEQLVEELAGFQREGLWPNWRDPQPRRDGEPCFHLGCQSHVTHRCEGCGRLGARGAYDPKPTFFQL